MAVEITFRTEQYNRPTDEEIRTGLDYDPVYASTKVYQLVQGSQPTDWIVSLLNAAGEAVGGEGITAQFRMRSVMHIQGEIRQVSKDLTPVDGEDGKFTLAWEMADLDYPGYYLAEAVAEGDDIGIAISPKPLRVEIKPNRATAGGY